LLIYLNEKKGAQWLRSLTLNHLSVTAVGLSGE
jgi:hypothetical protein